MRKAGLLRCFSSCSNLLDGIICIAAVLHVRICQKDWFAALFFFLFEFFRKTGSLRCFSSCAKPNDQIAATEAALVSSSRK